MTDYLVRATCLTGIRSTMEELGGDPGELDTLVTLEHEALDPESLVSYRDFLNVLEGAACLTACPHFGLALSRHQDYRILGPVGHIMRHAPDVRAGLNEMIAYFAYHNQGAKMSLTEQKGVALWRFDCKLEGVLPVAQQAGLAAGLALDIVRLLHNFGWSPDAVYFPHARPADLQPYKLRFNCPLQFDWECLAMAFDPVVLDKPIPKADPQLHSLLEAKFQDKKNSLKEDYCGQVRYLIRLAISAGDCSIERVANTMNINKRTLQRNLRCHNTSFHELLEEVRFNVAKRYLLESNGSLTTLTYMLGYSELSAFSNAFRRQYGVSPKQWRLQHTFR